MILLSQGFESSFDLLWRAVDVVAAKFGDIGQLLGTIAVGQSSFD